MVFGTSPLMPGGAFEIPGFDPHWQTIPKHEDQTVTVTYEDESTTDVEVKAGSFLRVYRQHDAHGYNQNTDVEIDFDNCSDDIKELEAPVASGETLVFEFTVMVTGDSSKNIGVCVRTPPNPTGGFQVVSRSVLDTFHGGMFGADSFNNPAGVCRASNAGALESHNTIRIRGVLGNGPIPGLLKLQLGPAEEEGELNALDKVVWAGGFGAGLSDVFFWGDVTKADDFIIVTMIGDAPNALVMGSAPFTALEQQDMINAGTPWFYAPGDDWVHIASEQFLSATGAIQYAHVIAGHRTDDPIGGFEEAFQAWAALPTTSVIGGHHYYAPGRVRISAGNDVSSMIRGEFVTSSDNPASLAFDGLADSANLLWGVPFPGSVLNDLSVSDLHVVQGGLGGPKFFYGSKADDDPLVATWGDDPPVPIHYFLSELEHTLS